ncbi:MAG: hypothetical protein CM15mP120_28480 [Pseudomonadota bacterium]|nr:MAG: hypothetical protein CM15mP120_28480 [Pseudomonadota bacterium]
MFWRVALPVARPAVVGGLALVLMETIADYGVVEHFGVPTFTTGIFRTWYAMGEHDAALKLAGCLFILVALLVLLEQSARRGRDLIRCRVMRQHRRFNCLDCRALVRQYCAFCPCWAGF